MYDKHVAYQNLTYFRSKSKSFDSGVLSQNESTTLTFDKPGTYAYHCNPHPNMKFTVTVK